MGGNHYLLTYHEVAQPDLTIYLVVDENAKSLGSTDDLSLMANEIRSRVSGIADKLPLGFFEKVNRIYGDVDIRSADPGKVEELNGMLV